MHPKTHIKLQWEKDLLGSREIKITKEMVRKKNRRDSRLCHSSIALSNLCTVIAEAAPCALLVVSVCVRYTNLKCRHATVEEHCDALRSPLPQFLDFCSLQYSNSTADPFHLCSVVSRQVDPLYTNFSQELPFPCWCSL